MRHLKFANCIRAVAFADAVAVVVAALISKFLYIDLFLGQDQSVAAYLALSPILALNLCVALRYEGFYEPTALNSHVIGYGRLLAALGMSMLLLIGTLYIFKVTESYSRGWFLMWALLTAILLVWVRVVSTRYISRMVSAGRLYQRFALLGSDEFISELKGHLTQYVPSIGVIGTYVMSESRSCDSTFDATLAELRNGIERGQFETVVIGFPAHERSNIQRATKSLGSYSTELLVCTDLNPFPTATNGSRDLGDLKANVVNLVPPSEATPLKLLLDFTVAGVGLLLLAPLLALVAVAIKLDSPGPVFFRQRRYGRNNRIFRIFKFRTMTVADDGAVVKQAEQNDARATRVGRLLRRTSLDEIPQLINVLKGEMSIVGPRPHAVAHDNFYECELDLFLHRRRVRPGLTGWAQIHGLRGETKTTNDMRRRMQHDLYYINNWSIWLDIEIITRTPFVLFRGAY